MPAKSKSQQRLFGMVHAYQKGKLKNAPEEVKNIARSISDEDAEHFAKTKHKGLPEKKAYAQGFMDKLAEDGLKGYFNPADMLAGTASFMSTPLLVSLYTKPLGSTMLKSTEPNVLKFRDNSTTRPAKIIDSLKVDGKPIRDYLDDLNVDLHNSTEFDRGGGPAYYGTGTRKGRGRIAVGFKEKAPKSIIEGVTAHELGHAISDRAEKKKGLANLMHKHLRNNKARYISQLLGALPTIRTSGKDVSRREAAAWTLASVLANSPLMHEEFHASRIGGKAVGLKGLKRLAPFVGFPTYLAAAAMPGIAWSVRRGIEKVRESRKKGKFGGIFK